MGTFERPTPNLGTERDILEKRGMAFVVDLLILGVVLGLATNVAFMLLEPLGFLSMALSVVAAFTYFSYLEAAYGQTLGKTAMDIVVISEEEDGPISVKASLIRTVLRPVDTIGILAMFVTDRRQRLGDLAADTIVVDTKAKPEAL
jgi:uncharacterized RDD family membrane protein YckC